MYASTFPHVCMRGFSRVGRPGRAHPDTLSLSIRAQTRLARRHRPRRQHTGDGNADVHDRPAGNPVLGAMARSYQRPSQRRRRPEPEQGVYGGCAHQHSRRGLEQGQRSHTCGPGVGTGPRVGLQAPTAPHGYVVARPSGARTYGAGFLGTACTVYPWYTCLI